VEQTEAGFLFAPKANQRINSLPEVEGAGEATAVFLKSIDPLRSARRLGPILFQLPPTLKCDAALLGEFLTQLPDDFALHVRVPAHVLAGRS